VGGTCDCAGWQVQHGSALSSCQADTMGEGWGAGGMLLWGEHATMQAGKSRVWHVVVQGWCQGGTHAVALFDSPLLQ
jgi:hypothetical protein